MGCSSSIPSKYSTSRLIPEPLTWIPTYGVYVTVKTKNAKSAKECMKIVTKHANGNYMKSHYKQGRGPCHYMLLGQTTPSTEGYPTVEVDDCKAAWVVQWMDESNFKECDYIAAITPKLKSLLATEDVPSSLTYIQGPMWHIEKAGIGSGATYSLQVKVKCRAKENTQELVELNKANGLSQVTNEKGALRYTIFEPVPGDEATTRWIAEFATAADHDYHKSLRGEKIGPSADLGKKMFEFMEDPARDGEMLEFGKAQHLIPNK